MGADPRGWGSAGPSHFSFVIHSMRVAIDARCLAQPQGTGVAIAARRMIASLLPLPSDVEITAWHSGFNKVDLHLPSDIAVHHRALPNRVLNAVISATGRPTLPGLLSNVDVWWQPNPLFIGESRGMAQVVTIHDLSFLHFPQFFSAHTRAWYNRWVIRWLAAGPEHARVRLAAVSAHTHDDILEQFPKWQGRVDIVPLPPPPLEPVRGEGARPLVLFVSTLEPRKNVEGSLRAIAVMAKQFPAQEFVFVGPRPRAWRGVWKILPQELRGRVRATGYVGDAERQALYRQAACLIYPSFYEGYGYPPLEAMAAGIPVIAAHTSSLPQVLGGAAIYIDPYRASQEIPEAFCMLMTNDTLRETMVTKGCFEIQRLHSRFDPRRILNVWQHCVSA